MNEDQGRAVDSTDPLEGREADTEGHALRPQFPIPPALHRPGPGEKGVGPGEHLIRGDGTPADFLDDRDTEGHFDIPRMPSGGDE